MKRLPRRFRTLGRDSKDHANDGSEDRARLLSIARPVPYHALLGTVKLLLPVLPQVTQDGAPASGASRPLGRVSRVRETRLNRTVDLDGAFRKRLTGWLALTTDRDSQDTPARPTNTQRHSPGIQPSAKNTP